MNKWCHAVPERSLQAKKVCFAGEKYEKKRKETEPAQKL